MQIIKNDFEAKFLSANEQVENANQQVQKVNVTIENWKYKYKCLKEKINDVNQLEEKVSSKSIFLSFKCLKMMSKKS